MARQPKGLAPVTREDRNRAWIAAAALRGALEDDGAPDTWPGRSWTHIDCSRPRRGVWIYTWQRLPGLHYEGGKWSHALLPGWQYTWAEVRLEMLPDLYALAERGERPTQATTRHRR